jgi:(p)ppGpp synthase/HD superfamily hydrolase
MIFNVNTQKAMKLCYKLHENQYDQNGNPYVFHLMYVAQDMKDEQSCIAALLHGTLADGKISLDFLREEGISEEVCNLLLILKRSRRESFKEYLSRIKENEQATAIKIADLSYALLPDSKIEAVKRSEITEALAFLRAC